ncbi:hypothetical protein DL764_003392 [Monosporascus ibericus]|uniref:Uncharacterized protein n=1 Tax=Monosporascus ibericus TaxID=155417 RepID=A0A4V1XBF1_9PEZI|nr:hypothetical protein DL764_003392 [Monosporascus ibericus]
MVDPTHRLGLKRAANASRLAAPTRSYTAMNAPGHMETMLQSGERPRINVRDDKRREKKKQAVRLGQTGALSPTSAPAQQPLPSLTPPAAGPLLALLQPPTLCTSLPNHPSPAAGPSPAGCGRGSPTRRSRGAYGGTGLWRLDYRQSLAHRPSPSPPPRRPPPTPPRPSASTPRQAAPKLAAEADEPQTCVNCGAKCDPDESEMGECRKHAGTYGWSCNEDGGLDHWSNSRQGAPEGKKSWVCCGKEDADATGCVPWAHTTETEEKRVQRMKEQKEQ